MSASAREGPIAEQVDGDIGIAMQVVAAAPQQGPTYQQSSASTSATGRPCARRVSKKSFVSFDENGAALLASSRVCHDAGMIEFPASNTDWYPAEISQKLRQFIDQDIAEGGAASVSWTSLLHKAYPPFEGRPLYVMMKKMVQRILRNRSVTPAQSQRLARTPTLFGFVFIASSRAMRHSFQTCVRLAARLAHPPLVSQQIRFIKQGVLQNGRLLIS